MHPLDTQVSIYLIDIKWFIQYLLAMASKFGGVFYAILLSVMVIFKICWLLTNVT